MQIRLAGQSKLMLYVFRKLAANQSSRYVQIRSLTNQSWFYQQKVANQSSCQVQIPLVDRSKLMLDVFLFGFCQV